MTTQFVPTIAVLAEIHQALWIFTDKWNSSWSFCWTQEDMYLQPTCRLADALHAVRSDLDADPEWPDSVGSEWPASMGRALRSIVENFDDVVGGLGWGFVHLTEPARSEYVKRCRDAFYDNVEVPRYAAARAWKEAFRGPGLVCRADEEAKEAKRKGIEATPGVLDPGACEAHFDVTDRAWRRAPRFGFYYPQIGDAQKRPMDLAFHVLREPLMLVARELVEYPWSGASTEAKEQWEPAEYFCHGRNHVLKSGTLRPLKSGTLRKAAYNTVHGTSKLPVKSKTLDDGKTVVYLVSDVDRRFPLA